MPGDDGHGRTVSGDGHAPLSLPLLLAIGILRGILPPDDGNSFSALLGRSSLFRFATASSYSLDHLCPIGLLLLLLLLLHVHILCLRLRLRLHGLHALLRILRLLPPPAGDGDEPAGVSCQGIVAAAAGGGVVPSVVATTKLRMDVLPPRDEDAVNAIDAGRTSGGTGRG